MQGAALRDAGIERVLEGEDKWLAEIDVAFNWWIENAAPVEFTLEQFRSFMDACSYPQPHHPNCWGGLAKKFADRIQQVGYTTSVRPQAHARLTRTYRRA